MSRRRRHMKLLQRLWSLGWTVDMCYAGCRAAKGDVSPFRHRHVFTEHKQTYLPPFKQEGARLRFVLRHSLGSVGDGWCGPDYVTVRGWTGLSDFVSGLANAEQRVKSSMAKARKSFKTIGQWVDDVGVKVVNRAEILAAMDCLMHHLKDDDDLGQWVHTAMPDLHKWRILDWDATEGASRTETYVKEAEKMSDHEFECVAHTFAAIVKGQCFQTETKFVEGAFAR